jgi:hypothetical protein
VPGGSSSRGPAAARGDRLRGLEEHRQARDRGQGRHVVGGSSGLGVCRLSHGLGLVLVDGQEQVGRAGLEQREVVEQHLGRGLGHPRALARPRGLRGLGRASGLGRLDGCRGLAVHDLSSVCGGSGLSGLALGSDRLEDGVRHRRGDLLRRPLARGALDGRGGDLAGVGGHGIRGVRDALGGRSRIGGGRRGGLLRGAAALGLLGGRLVCGGRVERRGGVVLGSHEAPSVIHVGDDHTGSGPNF